jgi:hypothetical protein
MFYFGIEIPPEFNINHWSLEFQKWIEKIEMHSGEGKETIHQLFMYHKTFYLEEM